jgi:hypothetical protein
MAGSTVEVEYDGVDITGYVIFADATFERVMGGAPGTFEIRCKDELQELDLVPGRKLILRVDGTPHYGGYAFQVGRGYAFPADKVPTDPSEFRNRLWVLRGVDFNILFDKRVLRNTSDYTHQIPDLTSTSDGDVITNWLDNYLDLPAGLDVTTFVDVIKTFDKYAWKQQGTKLRETLEELQQFTGALTYIDAGFALHYQEIDTTVKRWGFTDHPVTTARQSVDASPVEFQDVLVGPRELEAIEDISGMVNDSFVWGGSQWTSGTVFARARGTTDHVTETSTTYIEDGSVVSGSSLDTIGPMQYAEVHFGELGYGVKSGVKERAELIVHGSPGAVGGDQQRGLKYPQNQVKASWFAHNVPLLDGDPDHIVPGELVTFSLEVFGSVDPLILLLPMRSVRISFPNLDPDGDAYVQYDGFFGLQPEDPYRLWRFLLQAQKKVTTTINTVVDNDSTAAPPGSSYSDEPSPAVDGSTTVFTIPFPYMAGSSRVLLTGLLLRRGTDYTESDPANGEFTLTTAPSSPDYLWVECNTA